MERNELRIRKTRIGTGGQMTFLPGSRVDIEQSYRRSQGISAEEEENKRRDLAAEFSHPWGFFNLTQWVDDYIQTHKIQFGGDLSEFKISLLKPGRGTWMSKNWLVARGKAEEIYGKS